MDSVNRTQTILGKPKENPLPATHEVKESKIPELTTVTDSVSGESSDSTAIANRAEVTRKLNIPEGKHLAKRDVKEWVKYGKPHIFNTMFEEGVLKAVDGITKEHWNPEKLVCFFEQWRSQIEEIRGHEYHAYFGLRREAALKKTPRAYDPGWTPMFYTPYKYAIDRAVNLEYEGNKYTPEQSEAGKEWERKYFCKYKGKGSLRYGLIKGKIGTEEIPLTQYLFYDLPRVENHSYYGRAKYFEGINKESAIWVHPDKKYTETVMNHIHGLIDKALEGDLSKIPAIHWWYVQLAPVARGPGGIAEMITNTLCRLHGVDLPEWKDGIAPSVEVLLEPCVDRFSQKYHELFKENQKNLRDKFCGK